MSVDTLASAQASAWAEADASSQVGIVIIGAGPAAVMLLERLLANHRRDAPEMRLDVQLVDPHEPGGGRIWRRAQSPLLKLNSMYEDVAFFTDASCQIDGPVAPGPALNEWVELVRDGVIEPPEWADEALLREIATAGRRDFPTRRLNNAYLGWAYRETQRRAVSTASVRWHQDVAVAVNSDGLQRDSAHTVHLASGAVLTADIVVHAVGHNGSQPSSASVELGAFAERYGLGYVAPAFTADIDLDWVGAGEDVIVRGMGLAAVDLTVLLTEGRGGRFVQRGDGTLSYEPSGREPVLHLGSRRGVPYRSKITSTPVGEPATLEYLGADFREWALALGRPLDFDADAWPRIAAEMLTGYYRELFTGHPERVVGAWGEFAGMLRAILANEGGYESAALCALIAQYVPHADDRFELASFDRPLACVGDAREPGEPGVESVQQRVCDHIAQDLRQRTTQDHSATQALFLTLLFSYMALAEIPAERWNAKSRTQSLPKRWHTYFSYLASGPPAHRLEELLALADAGVLRFLGGDVELKLDEVNGRFTASGSARVPGGIARTRVTARTLIDAWLPDAQAASSDNPLLRQLVQSGQASELSIADDTHSGSTGQLEVDEVGALPGAPRQFTVGPFTSLPGAGAFTRPGLNSLAFRLHDRRARAILEAVREVASQNQRVLTVSRSTRRGRQRSWGRLPGGDS